MSEGLVVAVVLVFVLALIGGFTAGRGRRGRR